MKHTIYAIRDVKANAFMTPFFIHNENMAVRAFSEVANDDKHMIGKHPEDFSLYCVGEFDDQAGYIEPESKPVFVVSAQQVKKLLSSTQNLETPVSDHSLVSELGTEEQLGESLPHFLKKQAD